MTAEVCVRGGWFKEKGLPPDLIRGCAPVSTSIVVGDPEAALGGGVYAIRKAEGDAYFSDPALRQEADPVQNIDTRLRSYSFPPERERQYFMTRLGYS